MRHDNSLAPLDPTIKPESLPDRSKLADLYASPRQKRDVTLVPEPVNESRISLLYVIFMLTLPIMVTYLTVSYIYMGAHENDILYPLYRFGLSTVCFGVWVYDIRSLVNSFRNYQIAFGAYYTLYLFYLFPLLKIGNDLGWGLQNVATILLYIGSFIVVSSLVITYIFWVLRRKQDSDSIKVIKALLPDALLVVIAVFV